MENIGSIRNFFVRGKKGLSKGNNNVNGDGVAAALNSYLRKAADWNTKEHVAEIDKFKSKLTGFRRCAGACRRSLA